MPWKSKWSLDVPICTLPTWLFSSPWAPLPDKPVLVDPEKPEYHLSLRTYRLWAQRFAVGLKKAGFQRGDRVLLFSGNTIFFAVVQMGTIMAGGIFTGANPTYVPRELAYQIKDSGAKFLIVGDMVLDTGIAATKELNFPKENIFVFDNGHATFDGKAQAQKGLQSWTKLIASPQEGFDFQWEEFTTRQEQKDRTAVLNYSSGTTGLPKGVEVTHFNYISNVCQIAYPGSRKPDFEAWLQDTRTLSFLPMYHAYGQVMAGTFYPKFGSVVYLMRSFDFIKLLEFIQHYRITNLSLVPPIVVALTKRPEVSKYDLSSLQEAGSGAAPLGRETAVEFGSKFNGAKVSNGWGMTELTCCATTWDPLTENLDAGAVGELVANTEAMLVDDDDKEVTGQNEHGEIWIRGPQVMKGYWGKPAETRKTMTFDGWLRTGDIGFRDENNWVHIVDRKKELIKVKGNQVAPAELEALLLDHPQIDDVAVVGVTIDGEELPRAYVVLKPKSKTTPKDVQTWLAERVARHKRLEGGVVVTDAIPKNPSGKLLRKQLRELAAKEVADKRQSKL